MESYSTTTPQASFANDPPLLEAARLCLEAGVSVVPAQGKRPALTEWKPYQTTLATDGDLRTWFGTTRHTGMGIVCGCVSGNLEVLDFDFQACAYAAWRDLVEQEAPGLADRLPMETSQNGGAHIPYRVAAAETTDEDGRVIAYDPAVPGNRAFARRRLTSEDGAEITYKGKPVSFERNKESGQFEKIITLIETRSEGGFLVCAPSPGYALVRGEWHEIPTITVDEWGIITSAAMRVNEYIPPPEPERPTTPPKQRSDAAGRKPGDDYNEQGDVREVLIQEGWKLSHRNADNEFWTRPGKSSGTSASLRISDRVFYVFSSNASPFTDGKSYSPFHVYTLLKHGGDFYAAGKALYAAGYGERLNGTKQDHAKANSQGPHDAPEGDPQKAKKLIFKSYSAKELTTAFLEMKPFIIYEFLRQQETMNLVAAPKVGKSWLALALALCVAAGKPWLGIFSTSVGNVLLIDNELHPETLSARITKVAASLGINLDEIGDRLTVVPLRGIGLSYQSLWQVFDQFSGKRFDLTILDAGYRFLEPEQNENDNGDVLQNYNMLDRYAAQYETAFVVVHHTSKGSQADKATTDIGAGAGAQSRAPDTHAVLIPHETPGAVVMRVERRSGRAPDDRVLMRDPETMLWVGCSHLDPSETAGSEEVKARKKQSKAEKQREREETENLAKLRTWWRAHPGEYSEKQLRDRAGIVNPQARIPRLLTILEGKGYVTTREGQSGTKPCTMYTYNDAPGSMDNDDSDSAKNANQGEGPQPYQGFENGNW